MTQKFIKRTGVAATVLGVALVISWFVFKPTDATGSIFPLDGEYVSVDEVKREMDRGSDFVIIDTRNGAAYRREHITGAVSVPFFEMKDRLSEIPRDKWVVTYCACPRHLADQAAKTLRDNGYTMVKAIYEGYREWVKRGYPVTEA